MRSSIFFVLLVYVNIYDAARIVTNEDIRDAILSVVNMIRSTEDKLERHEFRERTLGDQIKKVLATIDKRQRLFDPIKGTIARLDERLANVETILLQKDERERIQVQKVFDMVEQIHNGLPQLFETLKNDITTSLPKESEEPSPTKIDLAKLQKEIEIKIDNTSSNFKNLEGQLSKIREENKNNFSSNQKFLKKYEDKLTECNKQIDVVPAKCKEVNDVQTDVILKALETQNVNIKKLQMDVNASNELVKNLEVKLIQLENDTTYNKALNRSASENLENVKQHINSSQEVLKKYEAKLNEYNKKIDVLPSAYKSENEAQTKSIIKAFETQNSNVQKAISNSKNEVLKNCEVANKYAKEAFPQQTKALDNVKVTLQNSRENVEKRLNSLDKMLNDTRGVMQNQIGDLTSAVEKKQNELLESLKSLNESISRAIENSSVVDSIVKESTKAAENNENVLKALTVQYYEIHKRLNNSLQEQAQQTDNLFKDVINLTHSINDGFDKKLRGVNEAVAKTLDGYRSKSESTEKQLLGGYDKCVTELSKSTKATIDELSKQKGEIQNYLARNISDVFAILKRQENELVDYNNKMDALPWKHKVENDRQTQTLLEVIESLSNVTIKSAELCNNTDRNDEILKALHQIEEDGSNNTLLIDRQNEQINKFLRAFEKELVFVTNAATSNIKDHIDRVSNTELQEFNNKLDALSFSLESAITQEAKRDAKQTLLEHLKVIENVANEIQEETRGAFKALENHSESVRRHLENQTLSSQDVIKTIESHLEKLHQKNKEHVEIASGIREDVDAAKTLIKDHHKKIDEKCSDRSALDSLLQELKDYNFNTTDFQKELQEQLNKNQNELLSISKEVLTNITALVNESKGNGIDSTKEISTLVNETYKNFEAKNSKLEDSIKVIEELTETLNGNIAIGFERLIDEMQGLQKLADVMAQTSDSVTDTKRRLEYGIRDISLEIGNLVKSQMKDLNSSVNIRFDNLQSSLTDNENDAIANISTSLTNDLDNVWRQIGIMHQEMTAIKQILEKLETNAETYTNGTARNLGATSDKVNEIRMTLNQMDRNLNLLLGRFSLITQEFNQVKIGVGNALNELRRNQPNTPNPIGPGPHAIDKKVYIARN